MIEAAGGATSGCGGVGHSNHERSRILDLHNLWCSEAWPWFDAVPCDDVFLDDDALRSLGDEDLVRLAARCQSFLQHQIAGAAQQGAALVRHINGDESVPGPDGDLYEVFYPAEAGSPDDSDPCLVYDSDGSTSAGCEDRA